MNGNRSILRKPTPGAIVRTVFPHFQLNQLPEPWLGDLIWTINAINAQAVAERFATQAHKPLEAAKTALRSDQFEKGDYSHQLSIWRILADLHGNDLLYVIIRTLFYFQVHSKRTILAPMKAADAQSIHNLTIRLIEAITSGAFDEIAPLMKTYEQASRIMKTS